MSFLRLTIEKTIGSFSALGVVLCILVCNSAFGSAISLSDTSLEWNDWIIPSNEFGNPQGRYISLQEWEELLKLEAIAKENGGKPCLWKVIYCISDRIEMVRKDSEGVLHIEKAAMTQSQRDFCERAFEMFKRCVFAYSGGNIRIESTRIDLEGPLRGEYSGTTFFWPKDFMDLGEGIDTGEYHSVIGHFYPGPVRTPFAGGTVESAGWCRGLGHSSVMLDPSQETGGRISLMAKNTLKEWLNQVAQSQEELGYYGMPDVSSLDQYVENPNLYYMQYIVTPQQWRNMATHGEAPESKNMPQSPEGGYINEWLVCGPFLIDENKAFDTSIFDEKSITPDQDMITGANQWRLISSSTPEVQLRELFKVPRADAAVFAHTYVFSQEDLTAKLWMGSPEPFSIRLNGREGARIGRGSARDTVVLNVSLKKGWNRLLIKKLDQDSGDNWWFTAGLTALDNSSLSALEFSAIRPKENIVENRGDGFPPIKIERYSWDEVRDDIWGKLPVISERHLEELIGQSGIKISAGKGSNHLFIDVAGLENIDSHVISFADEQDASLNNELNFERETVAHIGYTDREGKRHDLLFLRVNMVGPFLDAIRTPSDEKEHGPRNRVIGYILRDRKLAVVVDTQLSQPPLNEFDLLKSVNSDVTIATSTGRTHIIRGENVRLSVYIENNAEKIIDIGGLELTGLPGGRTKKLGSIYNLMKGEERVFSCFIPTEDFNIGRTMLEASLEYKIDGGTRTITKPVPIDVLDDIEVNITSAHSRLVTQSDFWVDVTLRSNSQLLETGSLKLELPVKWKATPRSARLRLEGEGKTRTFRFKIKVQNVDPDGIYRIKAVLTKRKSKKPDIVTEISVRKSLRSPLLRYTFDKGIEGDFAITEGTYEVGTSREKPFMGLSCLSISDEGGSHYGHVWMFSHEILSPSGPIQEGADYTYDTDDYPIIDFKLRSNAAGSSLGLHVILDDGKPGYGIALTGEWDDELSPRPMIGRIDFVPDGKWQHIVIDLQKFLDEYLGDIPHRIIGIKFGDTRQMDFGWWTGPDKHEHFIDEFIIRKR